MEKITIRTIAYAGLLAALGVVLKSFLGIPLTMFGGLVKNISLAPVPVIFGGILFGPVAGGLIGVVVDVAGYFLKPWGGYIPLFTLTMALYGVIPALFYLKKKQAKPSFAKLLLVVLLAQTICSVILNTLWLVLIGYAFEAIAVTRLVSAAVSWPVYTLLLFVLIKYGVKAIGQPGQN